MASLGTLLVNGDGLVGPRNWSSQSYLDIDEGIGSADGTLIARGAGEDADTSFLLENMPGNFGTMDDLSYNIRYQINLNSSVDDLVGLEIRIVSATGTILAAADSGGTFQVELVAARTPTSLTNSGATAFTYVNTVTSPGQWNTAEVEIRNQFTKSGKTDTNPPYMEVDTLEITGNYTIAVLFDQEHYRIRANDASTLNANGAPDWHAAEDTDGSALAICDLPFRIRFSVSVDGAITEGFRLYYQVGGGIWRECSDEADPWEEGAGGGKWEVSCIPSGQYTDLDATTQILTASAGTFRAGDGNEDSLQAPVIFSAANDYTELEWCITIRKLARRGDDSANAHIADAETIVFNVYKDDGTALNAYTNEPTITIANRPGHIGGAMVETSQRSFEVDKSGNLYYLSEYADLPGAADLPVMMKSTDGGISWNPVDEAGRPGLADLEAGDLHYVASDDQIHIGIQGPSTNSVYYWIFNCADHGTPDDWSLNQTVDATITAPADQMANIHRRPSDDTEVIFYSEPNGGNQAVWYRIRTAGSWGAATELDTTATQYGGVKSIMDPSDETIYIFYHTWNGTTGEIYFKTLTAADTLSGRTQVDQTPTIEPDGNTRVNCITNPVIWTDGATKKVGVAYLDDTTDDLWWNSSPTSSIDFTTDEVNVLTDVEGNSLGGASVDATLAIDDATDDVFVFGVSSIDQDLMYNRRVGGTWDGGIDWATPMADKGPRAKVFTHSSGNGGDTVVGFIHFDKDPFNYNAGGGGTGFTRYDEIVITSGAAVYPPFPRRPSRRVRM